MRFVASRPCDKCEMMCLEDELTVCYHFDNMTILGRLCDHCVRAWLEHEKSLKDGNE